jgi:hypothetical protein
MPMYDLGGHGPMSLEVDCFPTIKCSGLDEKMVVCLHKLLPAADFQRSADGIS